MLGRRLGGVDDDAVYVSILCLVYYSYFVCSVLSSSVCLSLSSIESVLSNCAKCLVLPVVVFCRLFVDDGS